MAYHKCASIYGTANSAASVQTASGAIANFNTKLAMPLKSLKVDINATQEAGIPTPESPKAISGFSSVLLGLNQKNWFNRAGETTGYYINDSGELEQSSVWSVSDYIVIKNNASFIFFTGTASGANPKHCFYDKYKNFISAISTGNNSIIFTTPTNAVYARFSYRSESTNIQLELGSTGTAYEPYNGNAYNILFPPYSENLPYFAGLLAGTHAFVDLGTLNWNYNSNYVRFIAQLPLLAPSGEVAREHCLCNKYVSNKLAYSDSDRTDKVICISTGTNTYVYVRDSAYSDKDAFKTAMSGIYLIYELAEAVTPTITPEQLQTLLRAFAGVYYGGYVKQDKDGHRKLVVTKDKVVLSGGETWTYNSSGFFYTVLSLTNLPNYETIICSNGIKGILYSNNIFRVYIANNSDYIDSSTDMRTIMTSGTEFTRTYETPIEILLPDGTPIKTLPGVNNIYADTGDIEVSYKKLA